MQKKRWNHICKSGWQKIFIMARAMVFLMYVGLLQVSASVYSQETNLHLKVEKASISAVLKMVEEQSDFLFLYRSDYFREIPDVTLNMQDVKLEEVLNKLIVPYGFTYEVDNKTVVIKRTASVADKKNAEPQKRTISGTVMDSKGLPIPGATVIIKGTTVGITVDTDGKFQLSIPNTAKTLAVSFIGMKTQEIEINGQNNFSFTLEDATIGLEEVVAIGYGSQKRIDITGSVVSLPKERLEMVPNLNIAQAIQGAIPGVMIQTTTAGAQPDQSILIRGRNSITASNDPLLVVDGIPYMGPISDINPSEVKAIEILKDASAAAIYGSRGANGVILITTKEGVAGKTTISYEGKYSIQDVTNVSRQLTGPEFYAFKMERSPTYMTASEQTMFDSGQWTDWVNLAIRKGFSQEHNISVSGSTNNTKYFISGGLTDVSGVAKNDNFKRISTRINVETKLGDWFSIGTRTQLSFDDASGKEASFEEALEKNPLSSAYDANGKLTILPWPEQTVVNNPLQGLLFDDIDKSWQILSNNYAIINFPFIKGLNYRLNTGVRMRFTDRAQYRGRDTKDGVESMGRSTTSNSVNNSTVIENILSFTRDFGKHNIFATAVYSYEGAKGNSNSLSAQGYPNDFLKWYSPVQASIIKPSTTFNETNLISQMIRLNYTYADKYLVTLTTRRDGYSGFGATTKWGIFPSVALGWNLVNEEFFPQKNIISKLKIRASIGVNGNQAIGAYETISRLTIEDMVAGNKTQPGYKPSKLGIDNLGWESSHAINLGLDFGIYKNRITGNIDWYHTNTTDLLLNRAISAVHGITTITQNIGETQNKGLELSLDTKNIVTNKFQWSTSGNLSYNENKIVSLYGMLDSNGKEIDDVANKWFIGQPINVNYDYVWDGVWQLDEATQAATFGSRPGYVKLKDVNEDGALTADDRQIIGQKDPKLLWGLTNTLSYGNFMLSIFIHGVHGATALNYLKNDDVQGVEVRYNTLKKNWWTPTNPTNDFYMNKLEASKMSGQSGNIYESTDFIRLKDLTVSYNLPKNLLEKFNINRFRLFVTGRNLFTLTDWSGMDPELTDEKSQQAIPFQKEYVLGLNLGF